MANRTTAALVAGIIEVDANITVTPFIDAANAIVTECCGTAGYTAAHLIKIETWLAAHVYTNRDMRPESESVRGPGGGVQQKFQSKVDLGFDTSHYGQTAMRLDWEGGLAQLNEQVKSGKAQTPTLVWMGTENPDTVND